MLRVACGYAQIRGPVWDLRILVPDEADSFMPTLIAMRTLMILPLVLLWGCAASPEQQPEVPAALQPEGVIGDIKGSLSGRGYGKDLVDALFEDVLKGDTLLRVLVEDLERQYVRHGDSTELYHRFEQQNTSYYEAAMSHVMVLPDSLERVEQQALLHTSEARHATAMARSRQLDHQYDAVRQRTAMLVEIIKLRRTRELMERYQDQEPSHEAALQAELQRIRALEQRLNEALHK